VAETQGQRPRASDRPEWPIQWTQDSSRAALGGALLARRMTGRSQLRFGRNCAIRPSAGNAKVRCATRLKVRRNPHIWLPGKNGWFFRLSASRYDESVAVLWRKMALLRLALAILAARTSKKGSRVKISGEISPVPETCEFCSSEPGPKTGFKLLAGHATLRIHPRTPDARLQK
jgi:hypothetical protein